MSDITHLLWLDLETTGTDERKDSIIEVGCLLTDTELNEIEGWAYSWVVAPTEAALQRLLTNPVVRQMHADNGLLWDVLDGKNVLIEDVSDPLLGYLKRASDYKPKTIMLAGSGVAHFDRRFLRYHMTSVEDYLAYPVLDVGVIRRAYKLWHVLTPLDGPDTNAKTHRALEDARLHLEEARAYKRQWAAWESL